MMNTEGVNDHPHSGWLGFYRHGWEKTGARSTPIVENNAVWKTQSKQGYG